MPAWVSGGHVPFERNIYLELLLLYSTSSIPLEAEVYVRPQPLPQYGGGIMTLPCTDRPLPETPVALATHQIFLTLKQEPSPNLLYLLGTVTCTLHCL